MHMKVIFNSIGSLLRVLITLDGIIDQHPHLKDDWNAYKRYLNDNFRNFWPKFNYLNKRMIKNVHHNPNKYEIDVLNKFYRYEKHLVELEGKLLDGCIFQVIFFFFSNKINRC